MVEQEDLSVEAADHRRQQHDIGGVGRAIEGEQVGHVLRLAALRHAGGVAA